MSSGNAITADIGYGFYAGNIEALSNKKIAPLHVGLHTVQRGEKGSKNSTLCRMPNTIYGPYALPGMRPPAATGIDHDSATCGSALTRTVYVPP
jgi:hypothetical protein